MCLTGVDYFSTLGYQPGIAFLAAGFLSPIATLILVLVTLFGALPAYARVARLSPHGQGSISVLEEAPALARQGDRPLPAWLCRHRLRHHHYALRRRRHRPHRRKPVGARVGDARIAVTFWLIAALGAVFIKGMGEAVWLAVTIVAVYLALNVVVLVDGLVYIAQPSRDADPLAQRAVRPEPHP